MHGWLRHKRVWVAGETGMVGQALLRRLRTCGCTLLSAPHGALDLRDQNATTQWLTDHKPDLILIAVATVGGIGANAARPGEFLYDNLMIAANIIHQAAALKVEKLLYLGSSCIYPKLSPQPIREEDLLSGALEATNEAYAIAKIAGIKLCQSYRRQYGCDFISAMPCNLYGPGDNFDSARAHVIPALIEKICTAQMQNRNRVILWGTGTPLREFLHADDLAAAALTLLRNYRGDMPVNIGSGREISIASLARLIAGEIGYKGEILFDPAHPDGTPRKLLDSTRMRAMGWTPSISLKEGLQQTIAYYRTCQEQRRHAA